ncbi:MAG: hypothetical protein AAF394_00250 [Planctomycetota bacterium]
MTNPFATFRKNQKAWMAALVMVALFAFVIAPLFAYFRDGAGRRGGTDVAVKWTGGRMTVADIQRAADQNSNLRRFMAEVARRVLENGGEPNVPFFDRDPFSGNIRNYGILFPQDLQGVVRSRFLASYGETLGVAFDDAAVDEFLVAYVDNKLTRDQVDGILREASNGQMSYFELREVLKTNLSMMVVDRLATSGLVQDGQPLASPGTLYNNFLKVNQAASIQAFPVFANDYLDQVEGSPTEGEIEALFSVGRFAPPNPRSPDPAFARTYRAKIEYVEIDNSKLVEAEKAKLTEEELKAEYDRRVSLGQLRVPVVQDVTPGTTPDERPPSPLTTKPGSETAAEGTEAPAADAGESEESGTENPATETPATETPAPEEAAKPEATKPEEPATSEETPTEKPADPEPAKESTEEKTKTEESSEESKPESGDQSSKLASDVRFVSFTQEEPGQEEAGATPETPAEEAPAAAQEGDAPAAPQEEGAAETPAAESTSEPQPAEGSQEAPTATDETPAAGSDAQGTATPPAEPTMQTQTFEEARETIADQLAREKVRLATSDAITNLLEKEMMPYYEEKRQYDAFMDSGLAEQTDEKREPPVKPDIKKLAEAAGFTWGETGLVDGFELAKMDVGRGVIDFQRNMTVVGALMLPQTQKFQPYDAFFLNQADPTAGLKRFLVWKTEDADAYAPELDEVREEVIATWKRIKARELAKAAAEEITKKVRSDDDPWAVALTDTQSELLVETSPFTWISLSQGGFSAIPELEQDVGQQFMQAVFATEVGGTAVGPSANNDIYYAIRIENLTPTEGVLRTRFSNDKQKTASKGLASGEVQGMIGAWIANLERELNFEWQDAAGQLGQ